MQKKIKIAGLIEYPIFQLGLANFMEKLSSINYVGNTDQRNVIRFLKDTRPDLLLINTKKNGYRDEKLIKDLHALIGQLKIAVFLNKPDDVLVRKYLALNVNGLILKTSDLSELASVVKMIMDSDVYISKEISLAVLDSITFKDKLPKVVLKDYHLTKREIQVMLMIYREYSNRDIGEMLGISSRTVESHRTGIIQKIGVKNSIGIAKFVYRNRLNLYPNEFNQDPEFFSCYPGGGL